MKQLTISGFALFLCLGLSVWAQGEDHVYHGSIGKQKDSISDDISGVQSGGYEAVDPAETSDTIESCIYENTTHVTHRIRSETNTEACFARQRNFSARLVEKLFRQAAGQTHGYNEMQCARFAAVNVPTNEKIC